jgi:pSer/pThr/pTyr-binding forkhead associated (FHA) protein
MEEWSLILNHRIIKRFSIDEGQTLTIGRGDDADVTVDNNAISRQHSSLELKGGTYFLTDLYSLNGTKVNNKKIVSAVPIEKTDHIEIGKFILKPTALLTDEEEVDSFASSPEGMDQTIYVQSKTKKTPPGQVILKVLEGTATPKSIILSGRDSIKVGKAKSCDLVISGFLVADTQFFINRGDGGFLLSPAASWRKVYLNGKKITKETKIKKGDEIEVASLSFKLQ